MNEYEPIANQSPPLLMEIDEQKIVRDLLASGYVVEIVNYIGRTFTQKYEVFRPTDTPCAQFPKMKMTDFGCLLENNPL